MQRDMTASASPIFRTLPLVITLSSVSMTALASMNPDPPSADGEVPLRRISGPGHSPPASVGSPVVSDFDPLEVRRIDLHAVEQSISDQGPLDASLRWIPSGLRLPTAYDQVYRRDGGGFWRANGGLVATFNQSIYVPTRGGLAVDIPASTVFVIGGVPMGAEPGHGRLLAADPLDPGSVPVIHPVTMVPDERHRIQAIPGDRLERFGFGPGHRIASEARPEAGEGLSAMASGGGSRFQRDEDYRAGRLDRMLNLWRRGRINPDPLISKSEAATGLEAAPSIPRVEADSPRPES
jgi:hypothetical protein